MDINTAGATATASQQLLDTSCQSYSPNEWAGAFVMAIVVTYFLIGLIRGTQS